MAATSRGSAARMAKGVAAVGGRHARIVQPAPGAAAAAKRAPLPYDDAMDPDASYPPRRAGDEPFRHRPRPPPPPARMGRRPPSPRPQRPPLVMLHGWMDVGASFQFVVDALPTERRT